MMRLASLLYKYSAALIIILAGGLLSSVSPVSASTTDEVAALFAESKRSISYTDDIRPLLDSRCVVCHGCYDAPCQLKLSSHEGLMRGASQVPVYDGARLTRQDPTRLFIDAQTVEQWRDKGFFAVLNEPGGAALENLEGSLLFNMLALKKQNPQPTGGRLSDEFTLSLDRETSCTRVGDFSSFAEDHPMWGMPYALPNLSDEEYDLLTHWIARGAHGADDRTVSAEAAAQLRAWEAFLNDDSKKQQLVSRYLYEHLFQAHLHFPGTANREFYMLVRSRTAPGKPIDLVTTVRPFDDPEVERVYYRLRRYPASVVLKNHLVYDLTPARMQRLQYLFLEQDYEVNELPSYEPAIASNPFKAFAAIPPRSRYLFLLDNARFFIDGFIRGPVCRGQIALNVIEDQFWVFFLDPYKSLQPLDPEFLNANASFMRLPAEKGDTLRILGTWSSLWRAEQRYLAAKGKAFSDFQNVPLSEAVKYVWDGDGSNRNAALTVFRHFDSASVQYGLIGPSPSTAWILDYPLFERIHYLLVAGFDVFGNSGHQLLTRLYMDFLRIEGESDFLAFLPVPQRQAIHDSWYVGIREDFVDILKLPEGWLGVDSVSGYKTDNPQEELYQALQKHLGPLAFASGDISRCSESGCNAADNDAVRRVDGAMYRLSKRKTPKVDLLPNVTYFRVRMDPPNEDRTYTLIYNKAYLNVTSMFSDEEKRSLRDYEHDTLTVVEWLEGAYPNLFITVHESALDKLVADLIEAETEQQLSALAEKYGIRRTNSAFWTNFDWFQQRMDRDRPVSGGILDLNRYDNI